MNRQVQHVSRHTCDLGEGLYCDSGLISWVDIHQDELLTFDGAGLSRFELPVKPSVIFGRTGDSLGIGADLGRLSFDLKTGEHQLMGWRGLAHDTDKFRSNDGCFGPNFGLVGFMHREDPKRNKGSICRIDQDRLTMIDDDIHIPNGFVFLDEFRVLICDSLDSSIYQYFFDDACQLTKKTLFHRFESAVAPDGGCLINNRLWFALWDGGALSCLDVSGAELGRVSLPCKRPTNCKYDSKMRRIVITSASEGLEEDEWQGTTLSLEIPSL